MKRIFLMIGISLVVMIITFMYTFALIFSFLNVFVKFELLAESIGLYISLGLGGLFAILALALLIVYWKSTKSTIFWNWLQQRLPKIFLFGIVTGIICVSIQAKVIVSFDNMKDLISIEWGIFGISVTLFLVWNVVILQFLKNNKPTNTKSMSLLQISNYIVNKGEFGFKASLLFNSVTLLIINTFVLIFATAFLFLSKDESILFTQNTVIVSFYLCTNTLICLFMDIMGLLFLDRKDILENTKVTSEDIELKNKIDSLFERALGLLYKVDKSEDLNEDQKRELKSELSDLIEDMKQTKPDEDTEKDNNDD